MQRALKSDKDLGGRSATCEFQIQDKTCPQNSWLPRDLRNSSKKFYTQVQRGSTAGAWMMCK